MVVKRLSIILALLIALTSLNVADAQTGDDNYLVKPGDILNIMHYFVEYLS